MNKQAKTNTEPPTPNNERKTWKRPNKYTLIKKVASEPIKNVCEASTLALHHCAAHVYVKHTHVSECINVCIIRYTPVRDDSSRGIRMCVCGLIFRGMRVSYKYFFFKSWKGKFFDSPPFMFLLFKVFFSEANEMDWCGFSLRLF